MMARLVKRSHPGTEYMRCMIVRSHASSSFLSASEALMIFLVMTRLYLFALLDYDFKKRLLEDNGSF
jgi:hypothetical protein